MDAAGQAAKEFGAEIKIIKKISPEYSREKNPPPCPSVLVNNAFIARNDVATFEAIKAALTAGR